MKTKYIMMVFDLLPDGTNRVWWLDYKNGLTKDMAKATRFDTARQCQDEFDDTWGDSFLQSEYGNVLTFDRCIGTGGDYTYRRYIVAIGG